MACTQCHMLNINGMPTHETGCPIGSPVTTCASCNEYLYKHTVYYANDYDGIKYCRECAERQAQYEAEYNNNSEE
jgi:formylmethanofuran dehydrogenase subunit E